MRFSDLADLFEDMHRHVARTGDSVVPADSPPLLGWTAVRYDADGMMVDPSVPRTWEIRLSDVKNSGRFGPIRESGRNLELTKDILDRHCPYCHLYVASGAEHGDEECAMRDVLQS